MSRPWESDRPLTLEVARAAINENFPTIDTRNLEYIGCGWDYDVYATSDGWAFRFPRRAYCADVFEWEQRIHDLAARALPRDIAVPRVELIGQPGGGFPYRFSAHRLIRGTTSEALTPDLLPTFALDIASALGALHSVPEAEARAAGAKELDLDDIGRSDWLERGFANAANLRGIDDVVDRAVAWMPTVREPIAHFAGPVRLVHQDLGPDHVIVDPATGHITGIIDWTDAILGDPARDFVFLVAWQGWHFTEDVLRHYPHELDGQFRERLDVMARLLTIIWLTQTHEQRADIASNVRWLHNAFETR
jgi:aminoglycoside phosphotransferase (APT) family kinase protein